MNTSTECSIPIRAGHNTCLDAKMSLVSVTQSFMTTIQFDYNPQTKLLRLKPLANSRITLYWHPKYLTSDILAIVYLLIDVICT